MRAAVTIVVSAVLLLGLTCAQAQNTPVPENVTRTTTGVPGSTNAFTDSPTKGETSAPPRSTTTPNGTSIPSTSGPSSIDCEKFTGPLTCASALICEWYVASEKAYCRKREGCSLFNSTMCRSNAKCAWDDSLNRCFLAPPQTNGTTRPAPINCNDLTLLTCLTYDYCGLQNFTAADGIVAAKCVLRTCTAYSASNCPARCFVDPQAQRCLPTPCWNFTSSDACKANSAGACFWMENSNRSGCFPRPCTDMLYDQRACQNSPRCTWDPLAQKCSALLCSPDTCFQESCSASVSVTSTGTVKTCSPKQCAEYQASTCPPQSCTLNANFECVEAPCKQLNAANCASRNDCVVRTSDGDEDGDFRCSPKPCPLYRDMLSCLLGRCNWDSTQGTCGWLPCYVFQAPNFTAADCDSYPTCRFKGDSTAAALSCVPRKCDDLSSVDTCVAPCRWDRVNAKCRSVPCSNYTQPGCPQGQCVWSDDAQLCLRVDCSLVNASATCSNIEGCSWSEMLRSCIDSDIQRKAPCRAATSEAMCKQFPIPSGRCTWFSTNATTATTATAGAAGTASGYCTVSSTIVRQCYEIPAGSDCPSYCVEKYDLCINPVCYKATDNVTCKMNMCRWNGASCEDPRAMLFPCAAYQGTNACPLRCRKNGTRCEEYSAGTSTGATTAPTSCGDISDVAICTKVDSCWFNQTSGVCQRKPCSQYEDECPSRCRSYNGACSEPCPDGRVFCPTLGTCAASKDACIGCSSNLVQCWDGSCKSVSSDCPCPPERQIRCPNGACVANSSRCEISCPTGTVRCWNNECAESSAACACPITRGVKCNVSGKVFCATDASQCGQRCTSFAPFQCWDGSCALNNISCPCSPQKQYRCETDFQCYATKQECPCRPRKEDTSTPVAMARCPDMSCRSSLADCNATRPQSTPVPRRTCPERTPFQCQDGSCAVNRWQCATNCTDAASAQPALNILSTDATFSTWMWFRLRANLTYIVCGVDRSATLAVTWTAYLPATGAPVSIGSTSQLTGTSLAIPPNTFNAGNLIAFVALVKVPGTDFSATATVMLTGVAPVPKLMMPSEQTSSSKSVTLAVQVNDQGASEDSAKSFFWLCSLNDGLSSCADSINNALTTTGNYVKLTDVPEGNYTFTAFYKGVNARTKVWVKSTSLLPVVQILQVARTYYAGRSARFYAVVKHSMATNLSWSVNAVPLSGVTDSSIVVDGSYFRSGSSVVVAVIATDATGRTGKSSVVVSLADSVVGSCQVTTVSDDVSGSIVALKTKVRVDSSFNSTETLEYRFAFRDGDDEVRLTSFWQDLPFFQFTAPVLRSNAARQVRIIASARKVGGESIFTTSCFMTVAAAASTDLSESAQAKVDEMTAANSNRDTSTVVNAARDAATALTAVSDASVVKAAAAKLLDGLKQATGNASATMSSSERSNAVLALQSAIKAQDVNRSQIREFVQENRDKILKVVDSVLSAAGEAALDVSTAGNSTLDVLARTQSNEAENSTTGSRVAAAVAALAKRAAQAAELGTETVLRTENITAQGAARAATDLGGRVFGGDRSGCRFPQNFSIEGKNETSVAQIASAQYAVNPVGTTGAPTSTALAANVAEFHVAVDGVPQTVVNQDPPLQISFKIDDSVNLTANTTFYCRYLDTLTGIWSSSGVTLDRVNVTERKVYCNTTHLSTFGTFADTTATGTSTSTTTTTSTPGTPSGSTAGGPTTTTATTNNGAAAPSNDSSATTGAIVGGCIGGVALIAIIGLVVLKTRGSRKPEQDITEMPLNELLPAPVARTPIQKVELDL